MKPTVLFLQHAGSAADRLIRDWVDDCQKSIEFTLDIGTVLRSGMIQLAKNYADDFAPELIICCMQVDSDLHDLIRTIEVRFRASRLLILTLDSPNQRSLRRLKHLRLSILDLDTPMLINCHFGSIDTADFEANGSPAGLSAFALTLNAIIAGEDIPDGRDDAPKVSGTLH